MVNIYTENLFAAGRAKNFVKLLLGRRWRGPKAVESSLLRGLKENGIDFQLNQNTMPVDTACVISGSRTLRWAIEEKKKQNIKRIIAGPNIVVFPQDEGGLLRDPLIDLVVVPSQWVSEKYAKLAPELAGKLRVWPAGVTVPPQAAGKKDTDFLVYNKLGRDELFLNIISHLRQQGFSLTVLDYGKFKREDYFAALERSKFEIYLSRSESQGLAMFEAWARGVPTFVWERGFFEGGGFKLFGNTSAPYLAPQAGAKFRDLAELEQNLQSWMQAAYNPRSYVENNFTDALCARAYLGFLKGD